MSDSQTCYKCVPPREIGPGQIEEHNKDAHGGGKHLVPHDRKQSGIRSLQDTVDSTASIFDNYGGAT